MIVHIGMVNHEYGATAYVAYTREQVEKMVADQFCRVHWHNEPALVDIGEPSANDRETIQEYFENVEGESVTFDSADLDAPETWQKANK